MKSSDNGNLEEDYGMQENQEYYRAAHRSGILKGLLAGVLAALAICAVTVAVLYEKNVLNIDTNGGIYISSQEFDENTGIGTKAEQKLNLMDQALDDFYFDDVDDEKVLDVIYKAYVDAYGDRYTTYYTAEEYAKIQEASNGEYCGIGVVVSKNSDGTILVVEPYDNSPGKEAGMLAGDIIISINGESVTDIDLNAAVAKIKGEEGTTVDIEVRREGVEGTVKMTVERRRIEVKTVEYEMLEDSIGYINIDEFDDVTSQQFKNAYDDLKNQGMQGLVIDIRSNPGGLLSSVIDMLDMLLPDGLIVYTEDKYGRRTEYNGSNPDAADIPMAVLVNENSASASEIFAGTVQDYGVGTIVGTRTFGKGIVQTIRMMTDGSAIKYTISKYYTPKGQDIQGNGVTPDITVEPSEEFSSMEVYDAAKDNQLQTAIADVKDKLGK